MSSILKTTKIKLPFNDKWYKISWPPSTTSLKEILLEEEKVLFKDEYWRAEFLSREGLENIIYVTNKRVILVDGLYGVLSIPYSEIQSMKIEDSSLWERILGIHSSQLKIFYLNEKNKKTILSLRPSVLVYNRSMSIMSQPGWKLRYMQRYAKEDMKRNDKLKEAMEKAKS